MAPAETGELTYRSCGPWAWLWALPFLAVGLLVAVWAFVVERGIPFVLGAVVVEVGVSVLVMMRPRTVWVDDVGFERQGWLNIGPSVIPWHSVEALRPVRTLWGWGLRVSRRRTRTVVVSPCLLPAPWSVRRTPAAEAEFARIAQRWRSAGGSGRLSPPVRRQMVVGQLMFLVLPVMPFLTTVVRADRPWEPDYWATTQVRSAPDPCRVGAGDAVRDLFAGAPPGHHRGEHGDCVWGNSSWSLSIDYEVRRPASLDPGSTSGIRDAQEEFRFPATDQKPVAGLGDEAYLQDGLETDGTETVLSRRANALVRVVFERLDGGPVHGSPRAASDVITIARRAVAHLRVE